MTIKNLLTKTTLITSLVIGLTGCAATGGVGGAFNDAVGAVTGGLQAGTDVAGRSAPKSDYSGPRARMAVVRFIDATGGRASANRWYSRNTADAMARKLTSSLLATKRFQMVSRNNMSDIFDEMNLGASGAVTAGSAAQFGKLVGARLIVTASITDFEESGGSRAAGGARSGNVLSRLAGATKRTYMAVNLEVVDVQTSEIIASEQIEASIRDVNFSSLLGGGSRSGAAALGISGWDNEPKGKALQQVINSAVSYLEDSVPERYYTESPA